MLLLTPVAMAADVPVPAGSDLPAAIAAASDGDRLLLGAGDHDTNGVALDGRVLDLVGEGPSVTRLVGGMIRVVQVGDGEIRLEGLTIDGEGQRSGVRVEGGSLTLDQVDLVGTVSAFSGAALRIDGGSAVVRASRFLASTAFSEGGHVWVDGGTLDVDGTSFEDGDSRLGGSILARGGATVSLMACAFTGNTVDGGNAHGGAIAVEGASLGIDGGLFQGNEALGPNGDGGAIRVRGGTATASGVVFQDNATGSMGGALACEDGAVCSVVGARFGGNQAGEGGALSASGATSLALSDSVLCGNQASVGGGALWADDTPVTASDLWLLDNVADGEGGAVTLRGGTPVLLRDVTALDNAAPSGGAIAGSGAGLTLVNAAVLWTTGGGPAMVLDPPPADVRHVLWFGNDEDGLPLGDPALQEDPGLPDAGRHLCDPLLLATPPGSPLVDAGDPALLDEDGTVSDIGAGPPGTVPAPFDLDGDGADATVDCDDLDPLRSPAFPERCDPEGIDEDCDGLADDLDPEGADGAADVCPDADGDGLGDPLSIARRCAPGPGEVSECTDCDDADPSVGAGVCVLPDDPIVTYGTSCAEARGCSGGAAWMMVLPLPLLARRRR